MGRRGLLLVVIALALVPATFARADPPAMFGVSVNRVFNDDFTPAHWDAPLTAVHDAGIRLARSDAFWMWAEPAAPGPDGVHTYDWTKLDAEAGALADHGLAWRPILDYSARWASSDPTDYHAPPTNLDDYAAYAAAFAERYGRGGSFLADHPDAAPVTVYEIWNEPNGAWFWHPAPDAATYADMYLKARAAIKAVDPDATVVVGGLVADTTFVEAMYAARPELKGNVDAVGWHPYAPTAAGVVGSVRALRRSLEQLGEPNVPIHITELGWPTSGEGTSIVIPEDQRAVALEFTADGLARSDCGVVSVIPYTWTTPEVDSGNIEDWYGLRHPDGTPTPSSDAYARVVARWTSTPIADDARLQLCHPPDGDADGIPDAEDRDDDNDGARDSADAFPLDPTEQTDLDGDGTGDNADPDDDNDLVIDVLDSFPADPNESADTDLDGTGDNADHDDDDDRLLDKAELFAGTSSADADSDDDGLPDAAEHRTSPTRADTDRDGIPDGIEKGVTVPVADPPGETKGTDLNRWKPDADPRTLTLSLRADTDKDGLVDGREDHNRDGRRVRTETDPRFRDTDHDRVNDAADRRPLNRHRR